MDEEDHRRLLSDVVEQLEELTLLINDLIDLARGEEPRADVEETRLDQLALAVVRACEATQTVKPDHGERSPPPCSSPYPRDSSAQSGTCSTTRSSSAPRGAPSRSSSEGMT